MHTKVCAPGATIVWSFAKFFVVCTPNSKPDDTITVMHAGVTGDKEFTRRAAARLCGKAVRYYHPIED